MTSHTRFPDLVGRSVVGLSVGLAVLACGPRTPTRGVVEAGPDVGPGAGPDAAEPPAAPAPIGEATMLEDGTLVLDLVATAGGTHGHGRVTYAPSDPQYAAVLEHLGGMQPGERRAVPPWPDEIDDARAQAAVAEYLALKEGWGDGEHAVEIAGTDAQGRIAVTVVRQVGAGTPSSSAGRLLALRLDPATYAVVEELVMP